jgi:carboxymethylenebutenolidase
MALEQYLREEILEEGDRGYVAQQETARRLERFDAVISGDIRLERFRDLAASGKTHPSQVIGDPAVWVGEEDAAIRSESVLIGSGESALIGYQASPIGEGVYPGIIVIHENRGLTPYICDVVRRLAKSGFVALAPDLLSTFGGTDVFAEHVDATAALGTLDRGQMIDQLKDSVTTLATLDNVDSRHLGVIGFCFGGGMAWHLITVDERLDAAVPFYGINPPLEGVPNIRASVLAIYGALDDRINAGIPVIAQAMTESHKVFEYIIYPDSQHAFHSDTNLDRYNPDTARAAWEQGVAWLRKYLAD